MNPHGGGSAADDASAPKACPSCGARYAADALFCSLDGSPLTTAPGAIAAAAANDYYVGREILDHIEIRQLVGLGAMGRVYRAFQRGIDRDVAVKILHRELSASPAVVARFHREAKVAARLSHPNVVHVLLVGQLPDGAMYIVMEYLDGMSLQSALAAAGLIFGTARYISPEGASGEKVGPQGDVYSMASMVYQMLSGRTPFEGDQAVSLLVHQIHDAPPPLKSIARASPVPDAVALVVMKNLSKRPDERAENGRAFGRALLEAAMASGLRAQDILARPSLLPVERIGPGAPTPPSAGALTPASAGPVRVAVETSSAKPGVGQPVDIAARVLGGAGSRTHVDGARFRVAGPGIPSGTELTALDDGSAVFRTTFTFLQPGRYDVSFVARADGAVVRGGHAIVVDDPSSPAAPAAAPPQPSSAPPASPAGPPAKWM